MCSMDASIISYGGSKIKCLQVAHSPILGFHFRNSKFKRGEVQGKENERKKNKGTVNLSEKCLELLRHCKVLLYIPFKEYNSIANQYSQGIRKKKVIEITV